MPKKNKRGSPEALAADTRGLQALEMRLAHKSYQQIADAMGYSNVSGPYNAIMRIMERYPSEKREEFRQQELIRLERIREQLAIMLPEREHLDAWLKVSDRIYRLQGIAEKHEVTGRGGGPIQTEAHVKISLEVLSDADLGSLEGIAAKLAERATATPGQN